jgi:hypothetical protein
MLDGFAQANRSAGGEGVKPAAALAFAPSRPVTDPFDTVEFDAHKLDLRLKILDQDPEGEEHVLEIERVWLLAVIDVGSRAILGYTLCLRREYSRYDVIRTFEKALTPTSGTHDYHRGPGPIRAAVSSRPRSRKPPTRAGGPSASTTRGRTWPPTASMSRVNSWAARSMWGPPTIRMIGPSLSASSAPSPSDLFIGCRVPRGRAAPTSFASSAMCAAICA